MADYSGIYHLSGEPPEAWRTQLDALASSAGLKVQLASKTSRTLRVIIHVPANFAGLADELVSSFLIDAASIVSRDPAGSGRARLVATSRVAPSAKPWTSKALNAILIILIGALPYFIYSSSIGNIGKLVLAALTFFIVLGGILAWIASFGANLRESFSEKGRAQDAVRERVLAQEVATAEDPKLVARLELARIALRSRTSLMRGDADRLWRRSVWAYRGAFAFFILAIAGPGVAAMILLKSPNPDWHFMFGGLSLAAVPLGIGTALLRHDAKLREQYQQSAQDVASLERYELALDYARIASQETYHTTMQQVIRQLILGRPSTPSGAQVESKATGNDSKNENDSNIQAIIESTTNKANEIITSIVPKKGA
ncbi:hypothetical protein D7Y13_21420 [Corallococcus praedator]|uniref:DUF4231 domain-containing protein n=2 Tax=Corallococcus TaxID=83461 RepID=A0ABX9QGY2_9BACT|nr:hypothetical protein [Corallococcus praedator]RKH30761.1 hypothetical protein D7X75_20685 [Corallococcus sp. CA031C]RKI05939.1 hypothetical protein D7Y13_21420 [Corallococcus praedator]